MTSEPRHLVRVKFRTPEGLVEVGSYVVYTPSPSEAAEKAENHARCLIESEVIGMMGPDADERMQDAVIR